MSVGSRLVERYIIGAITPYVMLALVLLTAVLFSQQSSRFAELLLATRVPLGLLSEVALALVPNVLVFTIPVATLAGTIIGFSRLGSDSEVIAMRAAGVGTWKMLWPALLCGAILSAVSFYINLDLSPRAARELRQGALGAALYKLDSPVEPRSFNTDIPGYVVYVRDGDKAQGHWGRVFIYSQDADGGKRLITARSGRIDTSADQSELVLSDAVATKLPGANAQKRGEYVTERLAQLRLQFDTGRTTLMDRLRGREAGPDELGWRTLATHAASRPGIEGREAATWLHKRITFSLSPLVFSLLGAALGLRVRRGGRGFGALLSLVILIAYYLISLLGEQMARAGTLPVAVGAWVGTATAGGAALALLATGGGGALGWIRNRDTSAAGVVTSSEVKNRTENWRRRERLLSFPSLLDISLFQTLVLSFTLAFVSLVMLFLIFTLFELWRFIASSGTGVQPVIRYLIFLLPLASVQLLPACVLIAILTTYALMARRSETIAWWASGQSVYRLMLPGLIFAAMIGMGGWLVQEKVMPAANVRQDALRAQIRGGVSRAVTSAGRQWLAATETNRLYAYEFNDKDEALIEPAIYEFDAEGIHLQRIINGQSGAWSRGDRINLMAAEVLGMSGMQIETERSEHLEVAGVESAAVFKPTVDKPLQLSSRRLSAYIKMLKRRGGEVVPLTVALQRKYAEPFNVLVMALTGMPLALLFGRKSAVAALCHAIAVGLAFWAFAGGFTQLGSYGLLPPVVAAWSPLLIFAATAVYLLSRTRT